MLVLSVSVTLFLASWLFRGQLAILRLEWLLDRKPNEAEVTRFLDRNNVWYSVDTKERRISVVIDTWPIPFDTSYFCHIALNERHEVISYSTYSESVAP